MPSRCPFSGFGRGSCALFFFGWEHVSSVSMVLVVRAACRGARCVLERHESKSQCHWFATAAFGGNARPNIVHFLEHPTVASPHSVIHAGQKCLAILTNHACCVTDGFFRISFRPKKVVHRKNASTFFFFSKMRLLMFTLFFYHLRHGCE